MKKLWMAGLLCLVIGLGCKSYPPRPDWVKKPVDYSKENLTLAALGAAKSESPPPADMALREEAKTRAVRRVKQFIDDEVDTVLADFRLQIGDLHDSQALVNIITKKGFSQKVKDQIALKIKTLKTFFDEEKKVFFLLAGLEREVFFFQLRSAIVDPLQASKKLSAQSKSAAKNRLDSLLKKEKDRIMTKWRNSV